RTLGPARALFTWGGGAPRLTIDGAQIANELGPDAVVVDHTGQVVLELGRIRELLPFERASEQMEAVLIHRFGQFQFLTGTLVDSGQAGFFAGRQRERHGNRLALRTREVFEVF